MNYTRSTSPDWPAKSCSNLLNIGIWRSSISLPTIVQLYHTYIQPVLSYGSETLALIRSSGFRGGRAGSAPPPLGEGPTLSLYPWQVTTVMFYGDVIASYKQVTYSDASMTISLSSSSCGIPQVRGQPHGFFSIQLDSLHTPRWAASPPCCSNHYLSLFKHVLQTTRSQNRRRGCRLCEGERFPCHWKDRQNGHWPRRLVCLDRLSQMIEKGPGDLTDCTVTDWTRTRSRHYRPCKLRRS